MTTGAIETIRGKFPGSPAIVIAPRCSIMSGSPRASARVGEQRRFTACRPPPRIGTATSTPHHHFSYRIVRSYVRSFVHSFIRSFIPASLTSHVVPESLSSLCLFLRVSSLQACYHRVTGCKQGQTRSILPSSFYFSYLSLYPLYNSSLQRYVMYLL